MITRIRIEVEEPTKVDAEHEMNGLWDYILAEVGGEWEVTDDVVSAKKEPPFKFRVDEKQRIVGYKGRRVYVNRSEE